jgi:hypothetical protein
MNLNELKQTYNYLVGRYKKAEAYLEDESIPQTTREIYIPDYRKIVNAMSEVLDEFKKIGVLYTDHQILNGFKEVE